MTNCLRKPTIYWLALIGVWIATLLLTGCGTPPPARHLSAAESAPTGHTNVLSNVFAIGETVVVTFSGPENPPPPYDERIKEDGTISMPFIGVVHAAGKTPGDLQKELQEGYKKYFKNITVTVKDLERYFYIDGEVRGPGAKLYLGNTDIVQAISTAGGFTDYAKKTKVHLIRNGKTQIINWVKAVDDPRYNVSVFPGDKIYVPRRAW